MENREQKHSAIEVCAVPGSKNETWTTYSSPGIFVDMDT
jgi:hypothetical protein